MPFLFEMQLAYGLMRRMIMILSIPCQSKLVTSNNDEPMMINGKLMDWNRFDRRLERTVKSLESRLVILLNWADFIM